MPRPLQTHSQTRFQPLPLLCLYTFDLSFLIFCFDHLLFLVFFAFFCLFSFSLSFLFVNQIMFFHPLFQPCLFSLRVFRLLFILQFVVALFILPCFTFLISPVLFSLCVFLNFFILLLQFIVSLFSFLFNFFVCFVYVFC